MKKVLAIMLAVTMVLSVTACEKVKEFTTNQGEVTEAAISIAEKIIIDDEVPETQIESAETEGEFISDVPLNCYNHEDYSISLIDGWEGDDFMGMYMIRPENNDNVSMFIMSMPMEEIAGVISPDMSDSETINGFVQNFIDGFALSGFVTEENIEIVSSYETMIDDLSAIRIELNAETMGMQALVIMYAVFTDNGFYMIMYTEIDGAESVSEFEEMVSSFRVEHNHGREDAQDESFR